MEFPMRINKYLAERGLASRREADALIKAGSVFVNGRRAELGQQVAEGDEIELRGEQRQKRYFAYYKGRGVITHSPGEGEVDIAMRLKRDYKLTGVTPIGRLDKDSEGLILLTDDGRITGPLLDPAAGHEKEYEVTVDKPINNWFLKHMRAGVDIEGYRTQPAVVELVGKDPQRFSITLTEGKKHQIRRMCAALGYQVKSLKRVRIMHLTLGEMKPNQYRKLSPTELRQLLRQLGIETT